MPEFLPTRFFRLIFLAILVDPVTLADQRFLHPALVGEADISISFPVAHGLIYYTFFYLSSNYLAAIPRSKRFP